MVARGGEVGDALPPIRARIEPEGDRGRDVGGVEPSGDIDAIAIESAVMLLQANPGERGCIGPPGAVPNLGARGRIVRAEGERGDTAEREREREREAGDRDSAHGIARWERQWSGLTVDPADGAPGEDTLCLRYRGSATRVGRGVSPLVPVPSRPSSFCPQR